MKKIKVNIFVHIFFFGLLGVILYILESYIPFNDLPEWLQWILYPILSLGGPFVFYIIYNYGEYLSSIFNYIISGYSFISKQNKNYKYYEIVDKDGNIIDEINKKFF